MSWKTWRRVWMRASLLVGSILVQQGCVIGEIAEDDATSGRGRGSAACQGWQEAFCDYDAECDELYDCEEEIRAIACESDTQAERCAERFEAASCDNPPDDCSLDDLVDAEPARSMCRGFIRDLCAISEDCGQNRQDCIDSAEASLNCADVDGVAPRFDDCLDDVRAQNCVSSELPASCQGAFKDLL